MMSLNRNSLGLAVGLVFFLVGIPALGQNLETMQIFAPTELGPYGGGPQPKEGYFFTYDGIYWSISKPDTATIGENTPRSVYYTSTQTQPTAQSSTLDNSTFKSNFTGGDRFEFGRIFGHNGWSCTITHLHNQTQYIWADGVDMAVTDVTAGTVNGTDVKYLDGYLDAAGTVIGALPLNFDQMIVKNTVSHWSVELNYIKRAHPMHCGGVLEFFFGARYLAVDERFLVNAPQQRYDGSDDDDDDDDDDEAHGDNTLAQIPSILADSYWDTKAENHVVGPELGIRYSKQHGRLSFSTEGRFVAGFNSQNLRMQGTLGTELDPPGGQYQPLLMGPTAFNHSQFEVEFSPVVELRAELHYQLTRAFSIRGGWTGMWMDNIARASTSIEYRMPDFALAADNESVFIHGLTLGIEFNR